MFVLIPLIGLALIIFIVYKIRKLGEIEVDLEEQMNIMYNYTETIDKLYFDMNDYKKDMLESINQIDVIIDNRDTKGLYDYYYKEISNKLISESESETYNTIAKLEKLKIAPLKGLILSKYQKAIKQDINFDVGVLHKLENITVDEVDLCRMIGILLDNAIEAASETEEKIVTILIKKEDEKKDIWSLEISNSFNSTLNNHKNMWQSSKGKDRGVGLKSLRILINKYTKITQETNIYKGQISKKINFGLGD